MGVRSEGADIGWAHLGSLIGELSHNLEAEPSRAAGDDNTLALESTAVIDRVDVEEPLVALCLRARESRHLVCKRIFDAIAYIGARDDGGARGGD